MIQDLLSYTDYVIRDADSNDTENNNGVTAVPQKYTHGELSKKINYIIGALRFLWCPYPLPIL